jgi:molybdate transport system regulatory protein
MSYMRAWNLVQTMNGCFRKPLVGALRGGSHRGGAALTPLGARILELYHEMETQSLAATRNTRARIVKELRKN